MSTDTLCLHVFFPISGAVVDTAYADNSHNISVFLEAVKGCRIQAITVTGQASPDGTYAFNNQLSLKRADNLAQWLENELGVDASIISKQSAGIDWNGLAAAVEKSDMRFRNEVLSIIRNVPERVYDDQGKLVDSRKKRLMDFNYGRTWNNMAETIFPTLRSSSSVVDCYVYRELPAKENSDTEEEQDLQPTTAAEIPPHEKPATEKVASATELLPRTKFPVFAIRTNLLLPLLNIGVEVPVGNHWSIGADYYCPWLWRKDDHKDCFQLTFFSGEARYWFGNQRTRESRLTRHSIAAYGIWGYYDFEHNWTGHQGDFTSFGADYLYALPVAKGRLRLEFQLAVGYLHSKAQPYDVFYEGGKLIRRKDMYKNVNYFGPTKVAVSLVLPLNKKGGSR